MASTVDEYQALKNIRHRLEMDLQREVFYEFLFFLNLLETRVRKEGSRGASMSRK